MKTDQANSERPVTLSRVARLWSPLALSWLLMAIEQPLVASAVARLPDETLQLAAFGGIAFPVALVVEGPIIMLLAASTTLCGRWRDYARLRGYVNLAGAALTLLHAALAFTPLYENVVIRLLGASPEIAQPGQLALQCLLPWTWAIAWRRFLQGLLIRAEQGSAVTAGTMVRLIADLLALSLGWKLGLPGAALAGFILSSGVLAEAAYISWRVRPVLADLRAAHEPDDSPPIALPAFLKFYLPLALTPLITLFLQPIGSAAMNRMPNPVSSLAAWPAVHGLVFLTRSLGMAFNEVVVSLLGAPGSVAALARFSRLLAISTMATLVLVAGTPLAEWYFRDLVGLDPWLTAIAISGVAASTLMPAHQALQSRYMGSLVRRRQTRGITESVLLYLLLASLFLGIGIRLEIGPGLPVAITALVLAGFFQTVFLARRAAPVLRAFEREESEQA